MTGICSVCKGRVPLITVKMGDLFAPDEPFEVCFTHYKKKWFMKEKCEGSDLEPASQEQLLVL